jgi:hypothetical protein
VKLIVVVFYFLQIVVVGFARRGGIQLVSEVIDCFSVLAQIFEPLFAIGQQGLVISCGNHSCKILLVSNQLGFSLFPYFIGALKIQLFFIRCKFQGTYIEK